jgi:protease I
MTRPTLQGKKVAILVADGFEQSEFVEPRESIQRAGATSHTVSPNERQVRGWQHTDWGDYFAVDVKLNEAVAADYDALLLPGGLFNPDTLRINEQALVFVRSIFNAGKAIAAICHGPWILISAGVVSGRRFTAYPSLETDLRNAGAEWVDAQVVTDQGLVTSRKPGDIPAFNEKVLEEFAEGIHHQRGAA